MSAEQAQRAAVHVNRMPRRRPKRRPTVVPPALDLRPARPTDRHKRADPQEVPCGFAQVPGEVIRDRELSPGARLLYAELALVAWRDPVQWLGRMVPRVNGGLTYAQLAANLGMARSVVTEHLAALERRGHIFREPGRKLTVLLLAKP